MPSAERFIALCETVRNPNPLIWTAGAPSPDVTRCAAWSADHERMDDDPLIRRTARTAAWPIASESKAAFRATRGRESLAVHRPACRDRPLWRISDTAAHVTASANAALSPATTPLVQNRAGVLSFAEGLCTARTARWPIARRGQGGVPGGGGRRPSTVHPAEAGQRLLSQEKADEKCST